MSFNPRFTRRSSSQPILHQIEYYGLSEEQKKKLQEYEDNIEDEDDQSKWENNVDLYLNKFPNIIQMINIDFSDDMSHDQKLKSLYSQINFITIGYLLLLLCITFGIPLMIIIMFFTADRCDEEWHCPDSKIPECGKCIELCPYSSKIANKFAGLLLFIVLVYQQRVEREHERNGNLITLRSSIFTEKVEAYNVIYSKFISTLIFVSTYILFVSNSDIVELLLNCLALTFLSTVDDLFGDYLAKILFPYKTRLIISSLLIDAYKMEKKKKWDEAIQIYFEALKISQLPCVVNDEDKKNNILYLDPRKVIDRIKQCENAGTLSSQLIQYDDQLQDPLFLDEPEKQKSSLFNHLYTEDDYKHIIKYSQKMDETDMKKLNKQQHKQVFYLQRVINQQILYILLKYIEIVLIFVLIIMIPLCI